MDKNQFRFIVEAIGPYIRKQDTVMRDSIKPDERLAIALRYLATGESFQSLQFQFRVSRTAISEIVIEVCLAITNALGPEFLKIPCTTQEWLKIADVFATRWNFPNGIGAIDGKRINIQQPQNSGSHYFDYKGNNSVILLAVIGPRYEVLWADMGTNGRASDGTIWQRSDFRSSLSSETNPLNIPVAVPLPGRTLPVPYVITGDDAFGLTKYLMKPYPQTGLTAEQRVFNYRLSRMRRISENAFGIIVNRWRVFRAPINLQPDKVTKITLAALTLHNYLLSESQTESSGHSADAEDLAQKGEVTHGSWLDFSPRCSNNHTSEAKSIREEYKNFFSNEGAVQWQWKQCGLD